MPLFSHVEKAGLYMMRIIPLRACVRVRAREFIIVFNSEAKEIFNYTLYLYYIIRWDDFDTCSCTLHMV